MERPERLPTTQGFKQWGHLLELGSGREYRRKLEENNFKGTLCYFIEVAFINISEVFIKKTTGAEKRLVRLRGRDG